ncbi:SusD/RagB family nutrient-binding outer membrane lipoprotein [Elizabethkingia miricola]|nr:SusD/RagB family nutrient-binding outer membrane lipoprotein [Elizabethkingia miricola]OPC18847.1 hypothetical protein BAY00_13645 [Elizabethkingia bruuniana]
MKKIIYIALGALSLAACKLDDNVDPNYPLTETLSPRSRLAAVETRLYAVQAGTMYSMAKIWTNTVAGNYYYYAAPMTTDYQMNITSTYRNGIWNDSYLALANAAQIRDFKDAASYPYHIAVAKILMANSMQYIVDLYGDAPYSDAFKLVGSPSPKYDKGTDIYKDLVVKLNEAINVLDPAVANPAIVGEKAIGATEDYIFKGDLSKWRSLANTIKLRILLRQSNVADASVKQFVESELSKLSNASFVSSDITINPGYNASTAASQNPLYANYGRYTFAGAVNNDGWRYYKISDHFAKLLNGDASKPTAGVVDLRGAKMYTTVGGKLAGIEQGQTKPAGTVETDYSSVGWKLNDTPTNGSAMNGYIMLGSESELLQAEAAILYPQYFSGAQQHYEKAVSASFVFYGLTAADATAYLTQLNGTAAGWTGAPNKIAAIQMQRLIALDMVRPFETYLNYLKTGYPVTPLALTASYPNKPYRLIYPTSEYSSNSSNVPNITTNDVFAKNQYTPFWLR